MLNQSHPVLEALVENLNFGELLSSPTQVHGGLLHTMWRIEVPKGIYAVKQISKDIRLTPRVIKAYELSEQIAARFKEHGIPAVNALTFNRKHLIKIEDTGFLIYPWVNATSLDKDTVFEIKATKIAAMLAKMHRLNLQIPECEPSEFDVHSSQKIIALIDKASKEQCDFAPLLAEQKKWLIECNEKYQQAIVALSSMSVISHGDCDQKNVLWDIDNNPILIDWESARRLNPSYEIVNAALDWSGITTQQFNKALFQSMIKTYVQEGGKFKTQDLTAPVYGVFGNWINWMVYNIERACDSDSQEQRKMGADQVTQVIQTLLTLESEKQGLIQFIQRCT